MMKPSFKAQRHQRLHQVLTDPAMIQQHHALLDEALPDLIGKWLGELYILKGIPFNYLIPDANMIPEESIRFFEVNATWLECLMDGAFSVGRNSTVDEAHDKALYHKIKQATHRHANQHRTQFLGLSTDNLPTSLEIMSGFFLRSVVVEDYPGMDIRAYSDLGITELHMLRLEKIAPGMMLGLFKGRIMQVDIAEPAEEMHFGVVNSGDTFCKTLRDVSTGISNGKQVTFNLKNAQRVIDITALAQQINDALSSPITAAEFGLEMVETFTQVSFT